MGDTFQDILNRYIKRYNKQYRDDIEMRQQQFASMDEALFETLLLLRDKFEGTPKMDLYHDGRDDALPPVEDRCERQFDEAPKPSISDWPTKASRA